MDAISTTKHKLVSNSTSSDPVQMSSKSKSFAIGRAKMRKIKTFWLYFTRKCSSNVIDIYVLPLKQKFLLLSQLDVINAQLEKMFSHQLELLF